MSRVFRVVLDTNVVLSALVFSNGRLAPLRQAWQQARCHPLVSSITISELIRALAYPKFKLSSDDQQELLADYLPYCITVRIPSNPPETPMCRDPLDIPFLELALVGRADHLVTGDSDLLSLGGKTSLSIISPEVFLGVLARESEWPGNSF